MTRLLEGDIARGVPGDGHLLIAQVTEDRAPRRNGATVHVELTRDGQVGSEAEITIREFRRVQTIRGELGGVTAQPIASVRQRLPRQVLLIGQLEFSDDLPAGRGAVQAAPRGRSGRERRDKPIIEEHMVQAEAIVMLQEGRREFRAEVVIAGVVEPTTDDVLGRQDRGSVRIADQTILERRRWIEASRIPTLQIGERLGRGNRQFRDDRPAQAAGGVQTGNDEATLRGVDLRGVAIHPAAERTIVEVEGRVHGVERTLILDAVPERGHLIGHRPKIRQHLARLIAELGVARERTGLDRPARNHAPIELHRAVVGQAQAEGECPERTGTRTQIGQDRLRTGRIVGPIERRKDESRRDGVAIAEAEANRRPARPTRDIDIRGDRIAAGVQLQHSRRNAGIARQILQVQEKPDRPTGGVAWRQRQVD